MDPLMKTGVPSGDVVTTPLDFTGSENVHARDTLMNFAELQPISSPGVALADGKACCYVHLPAHVEGLTIPVSYGYPTP